MLTLSRILLAVQLWQLRDLVKINSNNYSRSEVSTLVFRDVTQRGVVCSVPSMLSGLDDLPRSLQTLSCTAPALLPVPEQVHLTLA